MADHSLSTSGDAVSVTIPVAYYDRFQAEALFSVGSAADTISETAKWMRAAKEEGRDPVRELSMKDFDRFTDTYNVWLQVWDIDPDRDVEVECDREALRSTTVGCQLEVAEELKGAAEDAIDGSAPLVEEFRFWAGLREELTVKSQDLA